MAQVIILERQDGGCSIIYPIVKERARERVQVSPAVFDEEGELVTSAVYEENYTETEAEYVQRIATKHAATAVSYKIIDASEVPAERIYRSAWTADTSETDENLIVDVTKAKEVHKDKIRAARAVQFESIDIARNIAIAQGADTTAIEADAQTLRDLPNDPAIDAATTIEELKATWNDILLGEIA